MIKDGHSMVGPDYADDMLTDDGDDVHDHRDTVAAWSGSDTAYPQNGLHVIFEGSIYECRVRHNSKPDLDPATAVAKRKRIWKHLGSVHWRCPGCGRNHAEICHPACPELESDDGTGDGDTYDSLDSDETEDSVHSSDEEFAAPPVPVLDPGPFRNPMPGAPGPRRPLSPTASKQEFLSHLLTSHPYLDKQEFTVDNQPIKFWDLWKQVQAAGGYAVVEKSGLWPDIGVKLGMKLAPLACVFHLGRLYVKFLTQFEPRPRREASKTSDKPDPTSSAATKPSALSTNLPPTGRTSSPPKRSPSHDGQSSVQPKKPKTDHQVESFVYRVVCPTCSLSFQMKERTNAIVKCPRDACDCQFKVHFPDVSPAKK